MHPHSVACDLFRCTCSVMVWTLGKGDCCDIALSCWCSSPESWHYTYAHVVQLCCCRHDVGLGSVGDPGLGGRQRTGRLLAHKQHEHPLAGALKLLR